MTVSLLTARSEIGELNWSVFTYTTIVSPHALKIAGLAAHY